MAEETTEAAVETTVAAEETVAEETVAEETTVETAAEEAAADTSDSGLPTLEEYFNSDIMQSVIDATKEQYASQGISAEMYAEGDELRYDFTLEDVEVTEEEKAVYADTLKAGMEANESAFMDSAAQAKAAVSNDVVIVVVTYLDGAGNELYTQSFSSADAE